jgi:hypothetical protein
MNGGCLNRPLLASVIVDLVSIHSEKGERKIRETVTKCSLLEYAVAVKAVDYEQEGRGFETR